MTTTAHKALRRRRTIAVRLGDRWSSSCRRHPRRWVARSATNVRHGPV